MEIGYIGSSPISNFHIPALNKNGFKISAIGTTKNSQPCRAMAEKYRLIDQFCNNGWEEVLDNDLENEKDKVLQQLVLFKELGASVLVISLPCES